MFIERLINQTNAPMLANMVRFHEARHKLIVENISNASTPGYRQKDISLDAFQQELRKRIEERKQYGPNSASFDDMLIKIDQPGSGILFHDRNNRSMEQLMSDLSSNGLRHNLYVELLRKQFDGIQNVLRERIA